MQIGVKINTSPHISLLILFLLFSFINGVEKAQADSQRLYYICLPGKPCPIDTTIFVNGFLDKTSYAPGEAIMLSVLMGSDDNPQPSSGITPLARGSVNGGPYSADLFPGTYSPEDLRNEGASASLVIGYAPLVPGNYSVDSVYGAGGYTSGPKINTPIPFTVVAAYVCTGTVPANATMFANDDVGLTANTPYSYSATDTGNRCQYSCNNGYNWNGTNCVAPAPIANLSVNGSQDVTVRVGDTLNYNWFASGGTSTRWSSDVSVVPGACPGGPGPSPWSANNASGGEGALVSAPQAGCTYTINYYVSGPGGSDSDTVIVRVNNPAVIIPIPPTSITGSCPAPGTTGSISWASSFGATYYALRLNNQTDPWDGTCSSLSGDFCLNTVGTTDIRTGVPYAPGTSYGTWVHACNRSGCSAPVVAAFSCLAPVVATPSLTLVANPTTVASGGSSVLTWNTINASYCEPWRWETARGNSGQIPWTGGGGTTTSGSFPQTVIATTTFSQECWSAANVSTRLRSVTVTATAACVPDCSDRNQFCSGQPFTDANNCGSNNCTGTRYCDYNWREVAP